jgi:hypothetical protein
MPGKKSFILLLSPSVDKKNKKHFHGKNNIIGEINNENI